MYDAITHVITLVFVSSSITANNSIKKPSTLADQTSDGNEDSQNSESERFGQQDPRRSVSPYQESRGYPKAFGKE